MRAVQINKYGSNEVVEVNNQAVRPNIAADQILVEVVCAGLNPIDWKIREGYLQEHVPLEFPVTLGRDFSGIVADVGREVSGFRIGDEVYGQGDGLKNGSFAEYVVTSPKVCDHKPRDISHAEAAALPLAGVSAWQALADHMNLAKGQMVLIHGGAGGIGSYSILLAKHVQAYVATTVNMNDFDFVRNLGADMIIDYHHSSFANLLHDYDGVVDLVGGKTYLDSCKILKKGGILVSLLEQPRSDLMEQHGIKMVHQGTKVTSKYLRKLSELVEQKVLKIFLAKSFLLDHASEAFDFLQNGHPRGKVILKIKPL